MKYYDFKHSEMGRLPLHQMIIVAEPLFFHHTHLAALIRAGDTLIIVREPTYQEELHAYAQEDILWEIPPAIPLDLRAIDLDSYQPLLLPVFFRNPSTHLPSAMPIDVQEKNHDFLPDLPHQGGLFLTKDKSAGSIALNKNAAQEGRLCTSLRGIVHGKSFQ